MLGIRLLQWSLRIRRGLERKVPPFLPVRWLNADHSYRARCAEGWRVGEHVCLDCGGQFPSFHRPGADPSRLVCLLCGSSQSRFVDLTKFFDD